MVRKITGSEKFPVSPTYITNARVICGPELAGVRRKTLRKKPITVEMEKLQIPNDFYQLHRFVTLAADVMFVNGVEFLTSLSRNIRLITMEHIPRHTAKQLGIALNKIVELYARVGFVVNVIFMDQKFDKVEDEVGLVEINTAVAREHMGKIERMIRVIKKRFRSIVSTLLLKTVSKKFCMHCIYYTVMFL